MDSVYSIGEDIFKNAMEEYIKFFLENRDYLQCKIIQESRANIEVFKVTKDQMCDRRFLKHMVYVDRFDSTFLTLPYKYLTNGERIHFSNIRKIRYQLKDMDEINSLFSNTIDLFYNGIKVPRNEIQIALFDFYFVVKMPSKYKDFTKLNILMRPYIRDIVSPFPEIEILKCNINDAKKEDFFAYIDGIQTEKYSILDKGDRFIVRFTHVPENTETFELTFIRNLHRFGHTKLINKHIDLRNVRGRYPIPAKNIITFSNKGLFMDLDFLPKTGNILKSEYEISDEFLLFYVYNEYSYEDNYYDDNYSWYADYNKEIMDIINNPNKLPEFINEFYLFNQDISLSDFLENGYTDLNKYNTDRTNDSLKFNDELIQKVYDCIVNNFDDNIIDMKHIALKDYDLSSYTRYNNYEDIPEGGRRKEFVSKMYLFKIPNKNKYRINIYLDGIRYYDFVYYDRIGDVDYIYLIAFRVNKAKNISFEYIKTKYDCVRSIKVLGNNTKTLSISDLKKVELLDNKNDERFIKIFQRTTKNDKNYYEYKEFKSIKYDEENDKLYIDADFTFDANNVYIVSNSRFSQIFKFDTKKRGEGFDVKLKGFHESNVTKDNFRIFKTGRELPQESYTVIPPKEDELDVTIHIDIKYTIYELIEIEYTPVPFKTIYKRDTLKTDGKVDMYNIPANIRDGKDFVLDNRNQYYVLNGRRVLPEHYKVWCAKGLTLHDLNSIHRFEIKLNCDDILLRMMSDFYNFYKERKYLFSKFIVDIMVGNLTDDERSSVDINIDRTGELYWDLYQEFLKHNIISIGDPLPDYIAFKYNKLIDEGLNDTIMLNMSEEQLYWMPLDGSMKDEDRLIKILNLYYMLLDDMHSVQTIDPSDIPDELYEKYKELFDNNVLILQIPSYSIPTLIDGDTNP